MTVERRHRRAAVADQILDGHLRDAIDRAQAYEGMPQAVETFTHNRTLAMASRLLKGRNAALAQEILKAF